jgi:hypothetical protein
MAEMFCVGCGADVASDARGRRNLGAGSTGASEPREQALSAWISLVSKGLLLQGSSIENTSIDVANPGKMCKACFAAFQKYHKLQVQLEGKLSVALQRMQCTQTALTITDPDPATPPPPKRSCRGCTRVPSTISTSAPTIVSTASPPVSVCCMMHGVCIASLY